MRLLFNLLFYILIFSTSSDGQIVDRPPRGQANVRAVEGGGTRVSIDKTTSLDSLIRRLDGQWSFVETGKAYWIGYTNDMYSIAAYKDTAVQQLLDFYSGTTSPRAKVGIIYTLHLIGIESKVVGRFYERFLNKPARKALLQLCADTTYMGLVTSLLGRDPWQTDLPYLAGLLKTHGTKDLVNSLFRYTANDFPFRQDISESIDTIDVYFEDAYGTTKIGKLCTFYKEKRRDDVEKGNGIKNAVIQFGANGRIFRRFHIDEHSADKIKFYFSCNLSELAAGECEKLNSLLYDLIYLSWQKVSPFSYTGTDDDFHHYIEDKKLVICTWEVSRQRWLNYLKNRNLL